MIGIRARWNLFRIPAEAKNYQQIFQTVSEALPTSYWSVTRPFLRPFCVLNCLAPSNPTLRMSYKTLIVTYLLTYSMVQSPSWEANWFAASQEISRISRNPKVHYGTHKHPPPVSILGQPNPVHIPTSHLLEIRPNIIHPSTPRSPQWFAPSGFPTKTLYTPSPHPYAPHAQPISFFSILSPVQYWVRSTNHLAPRYTISSILPLPRPSYVQIFSSTPFSQTPSASFPPTMSPTKFHTHKNNFI